MVLRGEVVVLYHISEHCQWLEVPTVTVFRVGTESRSRDHVRLNFVTVNKIFIDDNVNFVGHSHNHWAIAQQSVKLEK